MTYAKIDDHILDCPLAIAADEDATNLHIRATIWCCAHLTDGHVPRGALSRISRKPNRLRLAKRLVEVGWWREVEGGWELVDFFDHNDPRAVVEQKRESARIRKERWKERQKKNASGTRSKDEAERVPERAPNASGNTSGTQPRNATHSSPLHSDPEGSDPPNPPPAVAAGGPLARTRTLRKRDLPAYGAEVEAVRREIQRLVGLSYPDQSWISLRRRLAEGASLDDVLLYVRWAADDPWLHEQGLAPELLFAEERFASGVTKAKAGRPAATQKRPAAIPEPRPPQRIGEPGARQLGLCPGCDAEVLGTIAECGTWWRPDPHACAGWLEECEGCGSLVRKSFSSGEIAPEPHACVVAERRVWA